MKALDLIQGFLFSCGNPVDRMTISGNLVPDLWKL
jgi:hypothetical protein